MNKEIEILEAQYIQAAQKAAQAEADRIDYQSRAVAASIDSAAAYARLHRARAGQQMRESIAAAWK